MSFVYLYENQYSNIIPFGDYGKIFKEIQYSNRNSPYQGLDMNQKLFIKLLDDRKQNTGLMLDLKDIHRLTIIFLLNIYIRPLIENSNLQLKEFKVIEIDYEYTNIDEFYLKARSQLEILYILYSNINLKFLYDINIDKFSKNIDIYRELCDRIEDDENLYIVKNNRECKTYSL